MAAAVVEGRLSQGRETDADADAAGRRPAQGARARRAALSVGLHLGGGRASAQRAGRSANLWRFRRPLERDAVAARRRRARRYRLGGDGAEAVAETARAPAAAGFRLGTPPGGAAARGGGGGVFLG